MDFDTLSNKVIGCAIEVHKELGPGLLENVYRECLAYELGNEGMPYVMEAPLPVLYKGATINFEYKIDFIIEEILILEIKSVERIIPVHHAQILTYMKLSKINTGLLINFNVPLLKDGLKRFVL